MRRVSGVSGEMLLVLLLLVVLLLLLLLLLLSIAQWDTRFRSPLDQASVTYYLRTALISYWVLYKFWYRRNSHEGFLVGVARCDKTITALKSVSSYHGRS